mmetsp:Transcript_3338/g.9590  ORF Transcript_3338/g.9590 Transcript_3338/m.9590 type:complete len:266 (+) Transcript_3338:542-1339(+)
MALPAEGAIHLLNVVYPVSGELSDCHLDVLAEPHWNTMRNRCHILMAHSICVFSFPPHNGHPVVRICLMLPKILFNDHSPSGGAVLLQSPHALMVAICVILPRQHHQRHEAGCIHRHHPGQKPRQKLPTVLRQGAVVHPHIKTACAVYSVRHLPHLPLCHVDRDAPSKLHSSVVPAVADHQGVAHPQQSRLVPQNLARVLLPLQVALQGLAQLLGIDTQPKPSSGHLQRLEVGWLVPRDQQEQQDDSPHHPHIVGLCPIGVHHVH